jgi:uncharacterized membrane protein YgcG
VCTCIYCVLYCLQHVYGLYCLCTFMLIYLVYISVRTTATESQLNFNSSSSSSSSSNGSSSGSSGGGGSSSK